MRIIAWLAGVPLGILLVLFAVSNRGPVSVGIWPFTESITAPAFVVALVPFALGLVLGAAFAGLGTMRAHWRHRGAARKVRRMEEQMADLRAQPTPPRSGAPTRVPPRPSIAAPPRP
jgi:lipopolysaccharide assembly protein A